MAEYAQEHEDRDRAIAAAYASCTYSMRQIGDFFGLHLSRISDPVPVTPFLVRAAGVSYEDRQDLLGHK